MLRPAELREKYAKHFEEVARLIRNGDKIPQAGFAQIYWADGEIARFKFFESGLDLLRTVGVFECIKQEHIRMVLNLTEHDV